MQGLWGREGGAGGQPRHQGQREPREGRVGDWKIEEEQTVVPRLLSYVVGSIRTTQQGHMVRRNGPRSATLALGKGLHLFKPLLPVCRDEER